jgi:hypothetical protein
MGFVTGISEELLREVVQTEVTFFKISPESTKVNQYGESSPATGKQYFPGIDFTCLVDRADMTTDADDFGPDRKQNVAFKFLESDLEAAKCFPQTGDLVYFNDMYHEVTDVVQQQFVAGQPDKSFSIIVNTNYTSLSKVDIVERQT